MRTVATGPRSGAGTKNSPPALFDEEAVSPQKQAIAAPNFHIS